MAWVAGLGGAGGAAALARDAERSAEDIRHDATLEVQMPETPGTGTAMALLRSIS